MATKTASEVKVESLEKRMEEMQDSIRRLAQESQQSVTTLARVSDELAGVRAELKNVKTDTEKRAQQFASKRF